MGKKMNLLIIIYTCITFEDIYKIKKVTIFVVWKW